MAGLADTPTYETPSELAGRLERAQTARYVARQGYSRRADLAPVLEPVATFDVSFVGFDNRPIGVPFAGTRSAVVEWTGELVRAGCRDVRFTGPDGLEVHCKLRRGAVGTA